MWTLTICSIWVHCVSVAGNVMGPCIGGFVGLRGNVHNFVVVSCGPVRTTCSSSKSLHVSFMNNTLYPTSQNF